MKDKLDSLLKEKYDQERKTSWKKEIPIPLDTDISKINVVRKLALGLIVLVGLVSIFYLYKASGTQTDLIDNYIASTPIAALAENVSRGEIAESPTSGKTKDVEFAEAAKLMKQADPNYTQAVKLLAPFALQKNKYQQEALWLKALAHAKLDENEKAISELDKLQAISTYQKEKILKLIPILKY